MSVTENNVLIRSKDSSGNYNLFYPVTKLANVDGLDEVLSEKADKATTVSGYGITDAYTKTEVDEKISGIEAGGSQITVDTALSSTSTNPVQNKVINEALDNKLDKAAVYIYTTKTADEGVFTPDGITYNEIQALLNTNTNVYLCTPSGAPHVYSGITIFAPGDMGFVFTCINRTMRDYYEFQGLTQPITVDQYVVKKDNKVYKKACDLPGAPFYINYTSTGANTGTVDKTYQEIVFAYANDRTLYLRYNAWLCPLVIPSNDGYVFYNVNTGQLITVADDGSVTISSSSLMQNIPSSPEPFVISLSGTEGSYTVDATAEQIVGHVANNSQVFLADESGSKFLDLGSMELDEDTSSYIFKFFDNTYTTDTRETLGSSLEFGITSNVCYTLTCNITDDTVSVTKTEHMLTAPVDTLGELEKLYQRDNDLQAAIDAITDLGATKVYWSAEEPTDWTEHDMWFQIV